MRNCIVRQAERRLAAVAHRIPTICVVDPQVGDYAGWNSLAEAHGINIHFVASAAEALRWSREHAVDLWMINVALADLSGYELCSMLRVQQPNALVCLLADDYSPQSEQAAWRSRAGMFAAKPAQHDLVEQWLASRAPQRSGRRA